MLRQDKNSQESDRHRSLFSLIRRRINNKCQYIGFSDVYLVELKQGGHANCARQPKL